MGTIDYSAFQHLGKSVQTAQTLRTQKRHRLDVDAVIVGAGPGGLVTATILAEGGMDVALVEAGQLWRRGEFERDMSWAAEHLYQAEGQRFARGNALVPVAMGKGVGGGTLVNSGICFRAPDRILDRWVNDFGLDFWQNGRRQKLYERIEKFIGVEATDPSIAGRNTEVARKGFEKLGVEHGYMPRNMPRCIGCGTCHTGCPVNGKASADVTWLPRMLDAGGQLFADSRVTQLQRSDDRITGVRAEVSKPEAEQAVSVLEIEADRTILAAGSVNTPLLLLRQNLGNTSGWVGENLRIQPGTQVFAKMSEDVEIWTGATQGYYAHHPNEPGVILETFSASNGALFTQADVIGYEGVEFLRDLRKLAGCGALHRDISTGTVDVTSDGNADLTYFVRAEDHRKFQEGLALNVEMFFEAGAEYVMPVVSGARFYRSRHEAVERIYQTSSAGEIDLYASHPLGTCRVHPDPEMGVVRPEDGRTHELEGLHISDASIFPTSLGVNPQMTIMGNSIGIARGILDNA